MNVNITAIPKTWYQGLVVFGGTGLIAIAALPISGIEKENLVLIFLGMVISGCGAWFDHPEVVDQGKTKDGVVFCNVSHNYRPSIGGSCFLAVGLLVLIPAIYKISSQIY